MSWMDLSEYLLMEDGVRDRLADLRRSRELRSPARQARQRGRISAALTMVVPRLFKNDSKRRIDRVIDYFGNARTT
jgi:hypothetical protein